MLRNHCRKTGHLFLGVIFLVLSPFSHQAFPADPLDTWHVRTVRTQVLQGNDLKAIAYGNGLYVAVGKNGTVATSPDQVNWTTRTVVSENGLSEPGLNAITFGNNLFVAVGSYIWTSCDGVTWTHRPCPLDGREQGFGGVAYGNSRFVAAGGDGGSFNPTGSAAVATSDDGITWVDRTSTSGITSEPTKGLIFANGRFVQVAWHQGFYFSTDGLTWQEGAPADPVAYSLYNHATGIAYGNGVFVVVGNDIDNERDAKGNLIYGGSLFTSLDGVTWKRTYNGIGFYNLCFGNGIFMGLGSSGADYYTYTSTNGDTWTTYPVGSAWGEGIGGWFGSFTLVGSGGSIYTTMDAGDTWQSRTPRAPIQATAAAYGNGIFVTIGSEGNIYLSQDGGITWNQRSDASLASKNFKSVVYGNKGFVAVGLDVNNGASVVTSADGTIWQEQAGQSGSPSTALAYGNGMYIGVGGSTIYSSPDGVAWTQRASGTGSLNAATFGNGRFVVVGDSVMTSPDGITWASRSSGTGSRLVGVAAGNNLFAAVSANGSTIRVSADGVSWSDSASGISAALNGIAFGSGRFVAIGGQGVITDSSDGRIWTPRPLGTPGGPWAITYGNTTFVAVTSNAILQSDHVPVPPDPVPTPAAPPSDPAPAAADSGGGGGCFIATAAYGSDFAWQVRVFEDFRDRYLLTRQAGRMAVRLYYTFSPSVAALLSDSPVLRSATRLFLTPVAYVIGYPLRSGVFSVLCLLVFVIVKRRLRR